MKLKYFKLLIISLSFGAVQQSCSDYLNVSEELTGGLSSLDQVFNNVDYTKRWYSWCYSSIPDYTATFSTAPMGNCWSNYADELYCGQAVKAAKYGDWGSNNGSSQRWSDLYQRIRQCNIFLEMAKPLVGELGNDASKITPEEMSLYKANVRFLRALYHYYLMELYGPVPIMDRSLAKEDELDIPRNSLDEVIDFIDREFLAVLDGVTQEPNHSTNNANFRATPTRGIVLAFRAKLWAYAASPLYNGGFTESLGVTNKDGKKLFPAKDETKKQKAWLACKDFIDYAENNGSPRYSLYVSSDNNPRTSLYDVFQIYNKELIWAHGRTSWGKVQSGDSNTDRYSTPRSEPNGVGDIGPVQELVDDFYMADGLPINPTSFLPASTAYDESGFTNVGGVDVFNMYVGREPRFYNSVCYNGMKWHSGKEVQFYKGGKDGRGDKVTEGYPKTGYLWYKRYNKTINGTSVTSAFRPSIILRLAEMYLLYAEVLNEVEPSNADVLKYVNAVRVRAGIPKLEVLNSAIAGDQALQREAIRRERRIELAGESQRYFDVRRWMIAEDQPGQGGQGGVFHGMFIDGDKTAFNSRVTLHTRSFKRKNYWYPIPYVEMQRSRVLVQNPGWN